MRALPAGCLLLVLSLAGCINSAQPLDAGSLKPPGFDTSRGWSMPLVPGTLAVLPGVKRLVPSFDATPIALGIFLPAMPGCDWNASALPGACRLPVVMDAGPYYADHVQKDKFRPPIVEWLVPRGYAVVQMSIRGTGESGGCMELFSANEQKDVDAMVTWLAEQPWSNGNVGMMGRSYDGTTPYMGAALGNPHLKTIVPLDGVPQLSDLLFKNGTSELRAPVFHNAVYWLLYGTGAGDGSSDPTYRSSHLPEQACAAVVDGTVEPGQAVVTGDASGPYFQERDLRDKVTARYNGSIWIIQGLQDWNVNPSQVVPWFRDLQAKGLDAKLWLGVWAHNYPDRVDEHRNVRWDWAEQVVEWFDYYLKGQGAKPKLGVEVEDSLFVWRDEATYPPADAAMRAWELGSDGKLAPPGQAAGGQFVLLGGPQEAASAPGSLLGSGSSAVLGDAGPAGDEVSFVSEPLPADLRIAGLPQLGLTVTPTGPLGTDLFAELWDVIPDGHQVRIGWGAIDVKHHDGGNGAVPPLVPGQPVLARMEFEPMDAHVARGHRLRVVVHTHGEEDILPSASPESVVLGLGQGQSVLRLPLVDRPGVVPGYRPPGLGPPGLGPPGTG